MKFAVEGLVLRLILHSSWAYLTPLNPFPSSIFRHAIILYWDWWFVAWSSNYAVTSQLSAMPSNWSKFIWYLLWRNKELCECCGWLFSVVLRTQIWRCVWYFPIHFPILVVPLLSGLLLSKEDTEVL